MWAGVESGVDPTQMPGWQNAVVPGLKLLSLVQADRARPSRTTAQVLVEILSNISTNSHPCQPLFGSSPFVIEPSDRIRYAGMPVGLAFWGSDWVTTPAVSIGCGGRAICAPAARALDAMLKDSMAAVAERNVLFIISLLTDGF
jgi:hypothetical protein